MNRRNSSLVAVTVALAALLLLALILASALGELPVLALDFTEHLFGIVLAVFVFERMLAWREARQWLAAKDWLYLILLETIDDLLKGLLPAAVPREEAVADERTAGYGVTGEPVHLCGLACYPPLRLLGRAGGEELLHHILWFRTVLGPRR